MEALFHVSDQPGITRFEPRPPPSASSGQKGHMVWAVGQRLLHNYLVPRDCPRVTFYAGPQTNAADAERFLRISAASHVVVIETAWLERLRQERLYLYALPNDTFQPVDGGAGYYISRRTITPTGMEPVDDILATLAARDVEVRITPSLWPLRDAVLASTMQFSFIRMRNAAPQP
ncbi:MAG: hypothetical protein GKR89_03215 [Candidatus Latescibacteria bacterium]|nr:hypothetical protein [Candidatus Latescibacterota bacterium]